MLLFRLLLLADAVGVGVVVGGGGGIVVVVTIQPTRIRPCWIYPIISHNQPHSIQSVWSDGRANDPAPRHRENGNGGHQSRHRRPFRSAVHQEHQGVQGPLGP